ncbi:unnamed protein product [marine sediment metagenome]|uniref:Uncharacterized protein n=1 Tax=marine sediment metagenome TaxID=412755 RepID=X1NE47_9ZZZZ
MAITVTYAGAEGKGKIVTGQILLLQMTSIEGVATNHGQDL